MAKKPSTRKPAPAVDTIDDIDTVAETLEDQMKADNRDQSVVDESLEPEPEEAPVSILRPSELTELIRKANPKATDAELAQVDRFRFLREHGLPTPLRRFRLVARRSTKDGPATTDPIEVDAATASQAIRLACDRLDIRRANRHRYNWQAVIIAE